MAYQAVLSLGKSWSTWLFQCNMVSIVNPRNLVKYVLAINLLSYSTFISKPWVFLVLKWIKFVLSKFNENKLRVNHVLNVQIHLWYLLENQLDIVMDIDMVSYNCTIYQYKGKIIRSISLPVILYGCEPWSVTLREEICWRCFRTE